MPSEDLNALLALPGVAEATEQARQACTQLRWHQALRRRIPEAAAESRVRGARASAALDGAEIDVGVVRDLMRGALAWPERPDPVEETVRAAVQATAEVENVQRLLTSAPAQAMARLHVAAGTPLLPPAQVGRPRADGEDSAELTELGPAPAPGEVTDRLEGLRELLLSMPTAPAVLVAALVHAEIATVRPFVRGNGLVARAMERAILADSGLDPTGVAVPEVGHGGQGGPAYLGALTAYGTGSAAGVGLWLQHCAEAVVRGAQEGSRIADAVLTGKLT